MSNPKQSKYVVLAIVICFTLATIFQTLAALIYPPDFSGDFPRYSPDGVLLLQFGGAFLLLGLTILGMKAEEEKNILAAGGFNAQAIAMGLAMVSIFEITQVVSNETFEKFYYITVSSNFLYFPSLVLIATYDKFRLWVKLSGFVASLPLLFSSVLFLFKYRDYSTLEIFSNTGYFLLMLVQLFWAGNVYVNYRNEAKVMGE